VINAAYSGGQSLTEIQSQLESARQAYETSQSLLEDFIQVNNIEVLEARISESERLFKSLSEDRTFLIQYHTLRKQDMENLRTQAGALKRQMENGSRSAVGNIGDALAVLVSRAKAFDLSPVEIPELNETEAPRPVLRPAILQSSPQQLCPIRRVTSHSIYRSLRSTG
jgi:hypothetical protein